MKKQIRIPIPHGSARVDEDCPKEVIEALHKLANLVYEIPTEQLNKLPVMQAEGSDVGGASVGQRSVDTVADGWNWKDACRKVGEDCGCDEICRYASSARSSARSNRDR